MLNSFKIIEILISIQSLIISTMIPVFMIIPLKNNFNYDIRSMINYLQANQNNIDIINNIVNIDNDCILSNIKHNNLKKTKAYIQEISRENNIDIRDILTNLLKQISNKNKHLNNEFFEFYENYLHTKDDNDFMLDYCLLNIKQHIV